jgi:hypothetical protein
MKLINTILSALSACVAFGTGWAIYTGATGALGMWWVIALIVAGAIIALDVAAGLLITDIYRFNQGARNQTERAMLMPVRGAWIALGLAIITEIVLSLLVVVLDTISVWGVLVFPPMTLAGIFVNSLRRDLDVREAEREQMRAEKKHTPKQKKAKKEQVEAERPAFACAKCDYVATSQKALSGHQRKHSKVTGYSVSFEPIIDGEKKAER